MVALRRSSYFVHATFDQPEYDMKQQQNRHERDTADQYRVTKHRKQSNRTIRKQTTIQSCYYNQVFYAHKLAVYSFCCSIYYSLPSNLPTEQQQTNKS